MASIPSKRASSAQDGSTPKKARGNFAAKMMAKMGYEKGQGLGKDGSGILNPIEVKLRPQGAGVGLVKEKTAQAKAEAKRAAERSGQKYGDSSDEERKEQRKKEKARKAGSGGRTTHSRPSRPKHKFRTAEEIEEEDGLQVPAIFKSLMDYTGEQPKLLTSTAGLMGSTTEVETNKLAIRAQNELEQFASAWRELSDRKQNNAVLEDQLALEIAQEETEIMNLNSIGHAIESLRLPPSSIKTDEDFHWQAESLVSKLEDIQSKYRDEIQVHSLSEIAVSAMQPLLKNFVSVWDPLGQPMQFVPYLDRAKAILGINREDPPLDFGNDDFESSSDAGPSPYESSIYNLWLPKVRSVIVNEWDVYDPDPLLTFINAWSDVVPKLAMHIIVNQHVTRRLISELKNWKPHPEGLSKNKRPEPHIWIFPWLERLEDYHHDPKSSEGLIAEVKRKFRTALSTWDPSKGVIAGIDSWSTVDSLRKELKHQLNVNLLPRLTNYLRRKFEIDPSDQDLTAFEKVMQWFRFFEPEQFSRVFVDAFFPKWLETLYIWLTSEPNYEEAAQWFEWWRIQFPERLLNIPAIDETFMKGAEMMGMAAELGPEKSKTELSLATYANDQLVEEQARAQEPEKPKSQQPRQSEPEEEQIDFQDIVEDYCAQYDLTMLKLPKVHLETGRPLYKITASASGTGGINIYFQGDVAFAQNRKDRSQWDPIDLESLPKLAGA